MSVIVLNNPSSGSSYKGFPTEDINIISKSLVLNKLSIKYEDPSNSIENGTAISTWAGTILVMKSGSYPTSPTDGTVLINSTTRNEYKDSAYTCTISSSTISSSTIYFRFYTYNTDKVYNDSSSMMFTLTNITADPILANNTWAKIAEASEAGIAQELWNIGDEIDITISEVDIAVSGNAYDEVCPSQTITLQIWDFDHFDKSDGSGKAGILFGMKNILYTSGINDGSCIFFMNGTSRYNDGGWNSCHLKNTIMPRILSSMPSDLQSAIKEVNTYANAGNYSSEASVGTLSIDKLFVPGAIELNDESYYYNKNQGITESNQFAIPIFTDDTSRIKKGKNGSGDIKNWWTRSAKYDTNTAYIIVSDGTNGTSTRAGQLNTLKPSFGIGLCFCFCV